MTLKTYYTATLLTSLLYLSSCTIYNSRSFIKSHLPTDTIDTIKGLAHIMKNLDKDSNEELQVFLVHGMRTHGPNAYDTVVSQYARILDLDFIDTRTYKVKTGDGIMWKRNHGIFPSLKLYFYKKDDVPVRFTYIHWSPLTSQYKSDIKKYDKPPRRATINSSLKNQIVNDGFGDLAAVTDAGIQKDLYALFDAAIKLQYIKSEDLLDKNRTTLTRSNPIELANVALISASLGSKLMAEYLQVFYTKNLLSSLDILNSIASDTIIKKHIQKGIEFDYKQQDILYDTEAQQEFILKEFSQRERSTLTLEVDKINLHWYLLSNQLSLLNGLDLDFGLHQYNSTDASLEVVEYADSLVRSKFSKSVTQVSFYEQNDFLGYYVPDGLSGYDSKPINISVPLDKVIFFNFLASPMKVHTGAKLDKHVSYIITKGWVTEEKLPRGLSIREMIKQ